MAHYKILGQDPYWMNFYGLMILTLIEVLAVGADLSLIHISEPTRPY